MQKPPLQEPSRHEIWKMFDQISPTYDRVNRAITLGLDVYWRKKMCSFLPQKKGISLLDLATGTGDQIIAIMERSQNISGAIGIDLAADMLEIGREKLRPKPYTKKVHLDNASAMEIPFADNTFDCATMSFGIRNVTDVPKCLKEICRVLKPGGRVLILEGTVPSYSVVKKIHLFYLRNCLPRIGGWISKRKDAYEYLNKTIETFPSGKAFCDLLTDAGFAAAKAHPLTFGIATIYTGDKG